MPPKARITKNMVIEAAFETVREAGAESINARTIAQKLSCSTQPVMYHFKTMEQLKRAVYTKSGWYHTEYLMRLREPGENVMLGIGLNYIRFAMEEPHLFRFLFQSDVFHGSTLPEMTDARELTPVLSAIQAEMGGGSIEQAKEIFLTIFLFAHGYASIIANNSLEYDEELIKAHLERAFHGAVLAARKDTK